MSKLETNTIDTISGSTNLTLGGTNATDITIPSGVTITNNGTQSGFGGTMTPAFEVYRSGDQAISDATYTKIQLNTEILDTDGNYDNATNYRFTPTTAGKYYVYGNLTMYSDTNNTIDNFIIAIYKNGSNYKAQEMRVQNQETRRETINTSAIIDFNGSSDYVELFAFCDVTSGTPYIDSTLKYTNFGAFKIIE